VIVGGTGSRRTPQLAARYADEYNVAFASAEEVRAAYERVAVACEREGRDAAGHAPLVLSTAQTVVCGRNDAEVARRRAAVGGSPRLAGTPAQVVDQIGGYLELGASRLFLQIIDLADLDHLDLIAAEVAPQLPG
jgi:alkanesulfonate monooxygenase SsuD/methylene tetrahydromethanopterin reductase-like flavin-dependent oxidoreductase (luciferase family)